MQSVLRRPDNGSAGLADCQPLVADRLSINGVISVAPTGPGERAVQLPWFWPDAASFRILAESPTALPWSAVRADPGLLFFLFGREVLFDGDAVGPIGAAELRAAAAMLENCSAPWVSWDDVS